MNKASKSELNIGSKNPSAPLYNVVQITEIFNSLFFESHNTRLEGGVSEPLYRPANSPGNQSTTWHQINFTRDYFASALHEVAHWCVAGERRRLEVDYGYWYSPDGRNDSQQILFEKVEIKPQALEWMFSTAANYRFQLSSDNLVGCAGPSENFKSNVCNQIHSYCEKGFPSRAKLFAEKLQHYFGGINYENKSSYQIEML